MLAHVDGAEADTSFHFLHPKSETPPRHIGRDWLLLPAVAAGTIVVLRMERPQDQWAELNVVFEPGGVARLSPPAAVAEPAAPEADDEAAEDETLANAPSPPPQTEHPSQADSNEVDDAGQSLALQEEPAMPRPRRIPEPGMFTLLVVGAAAALTRCLRSRRW